GQVRGSDFAGEDFFNALLKIWLGNKPVQDDLKQALLGKAS
ncbi:MAG: chalcone isomerase family protein, partial [Propionivibrio sp.]|nr:chalcone isomerase family protein [Propionivibrio sp.]